MNTYFLALGSNVNPITNHKKAIAEISSISDSVQQSPFYLTQSIDERYGAHFINIIISSANEQPADKFKQETIRSIEEKVCRRARNKNKFSPLTMDIDIILSIDETGRASNIDIDLLRHRYVLTGLSELIPNYSISPLKKTVRELLASCTEKHGVIQLSPTEIQQYE